MRLVITLISTAYFSLLLLGYCYQLRQKKIPAKFTFPAILPILGIVDVWGNYTYQRLEILLALGILLLGISVGN